MNTAPMTSEHFGSTAERLNAICDAQPFSRGFFHQKYRSGEIF